MTAADRQRARSRAWKANNPDRVREYQVAYYRRYWAERGAEIRPIKAEYKRRYRARVAAAKRVEESERIRTAWLDQGRAA